MIRLARTRDATKLTEFTGVKLASKLNNLLNYYYIDGGNIDFKVKTRQIWGKAKAQLRSESGGKCAYCEVPTAVVAHGDVEHFRPKSTYWWLAYCYDNYTFSCQICNQSYKGDAFPVSGTRLISPLLPAAKPIDLTALAAALCPDPAVIDDAAVKKLFLSEVANLPHPYIDDPEKLFAWKVDDVLTEVRLVSKGRSRRATAAVKAAEDYLGLNREELVRLRFQEYLTLETMVLALQEGNLSKDMALRVHARVLNSAKFDQPFAGMKRYFLREWGLM